MFGRKLLQLACVHHVKEVMAGDVFGELFGPTTAPETCIFVRFRTEWPNIDKSLVDPPLIGARAITIKNFNLIPEYRYLNAGLCSFSALDSKSLARDDQKESIVLIISFLTGAPPLSFQAPGAASTARWLAKILYGMKIGSFRRQFALT